MFIGQCSSIIGVCVVYGLSSLVHPFYCLYKPLIDKKKRGRKQHQYPKREKRAFERYTQQRQIIEREELIARGEEDQETD
jgi:hypothetical protein